LGVQRGDGTHKITQRKYVRGKKKHQSIFLRGSQLGNSIWRGSRKAEKQRSARVAEVRARNERREKKNPKIPRKEAAVKCEPRKRRLKRRKKKQRGERAVQRERRGDELAAIIWLGPEDFRR